MNKERKSKELKKGISLIVLVITIIVIVILAVAVILSIANNNPIEQSKKAKFQNDLKTMQEELNLYIASQTTNNLGEFDIEGLDLTEYDDIKGVITSITDEYKDKVKVVNGKLVFTGNNTQEIEWAYELLGGINTDKEIINSKAMSLSNSVATTPLNLNIYGTNSGVGDKTKNLFDKNTAILNVYINSSNGNAKAATEYFGSDFIEVNSGDTYYWNDKTLRINQGAWYDKDKKYISGINRTYVFTAPDNAKYIKLTGRKSDLDLESYQLEKGATSTKYEPYGYKIPIKVNENEEYNVYIAEPLRQVGEYVDYVDVVNKKVHRNVQVKEDGTLSGREEELIEDVIDVDNIALDEGENTVTVDTANTPSKIEITYLSKKYEE